MDHYAGNASSYPTTVALIDDSDVPDAADFNPGMQDLADRTAWIKLRAPNFLDGGTYAPTTPVIVGGQGMQIPDGAQWDVFGGLYFDGTGSSMPALTLDGPGASVTLQGGAVMHVTSASSLIVNSGGQGAWFSGSIFALGSGVNATVAGTLDWLSGAHADFEAGGILHVKTSAQFVLDRGDGMRITDATAPLYLTPLTRAIAQPLVLDGAIGGFNYTTPNIVTDNAGGNVISISMTKLINGAKLHSVLIRQSGWTAHVAPTSAATMTLQKASLVDGTVTSIHTWTIDTTTTPPSTFLIYMLPADETIDDSIYTYHLQLKGENGGSAQSIDWHMPRLFFTTINYLGQF